METKELRTILFEIKSLCEVFDEKYLSTIHKLAEKAIKLSSDSSACDKPLKSGVTASEFTVSDEEIEEITDILFGIDFMQDKNKDYRSDIDRRIGCVRALQYIRDTHATGKATVDLVEALKDVMRLQDLWLPAHVKEEHRGEAEALHKMRDKILQALSTHKDKEDE